MRLLADWRDVSCTQLYNKMCGLPKTSWFSTTPKVPKARIEPSPPFSNCAVDFFGLFHIKERRSQENATVFFLPAWPAEVFTWKLLTL